MPRQRIIALSADPRFAAGLRTALADAGEVVHATTIDQVDSAAALVIVHLAGAHDDAMPAVCARLRSSARSIAVLPRPDLARTVALLQLDSRVVGVTTEVARIAALATAAIRPPVHPVHTLSVGSYEEKLQCIAQVGELAHGLRVRHKYREAIEKCLDEMLMNALYDAPPDRNAPPARAQVSFASDGSRCYLTVRDAYGSLERPTVLRYLHKCLHEKQQIDRKVGGAGLGLYFMASSSSELHFHVARGRATEVTCVFDLTARNVILQSFGCVVDESSIARPRRIVPILLAAILATLVAMMWTWFAR